MAAATVLITLTVHDGREDEYLRWQDRVKKVMSRFSGFEAMDVYPPTSGGMNQWVIIFRFSEIGRLASWLNSRERQELLDEGRYLFEEQAQEILAAEKAPIQDIVTAVISHDIRPGHERDFEQWQEKVRKVMGKSPGFMGYELFRPVPPLQEKWVAVFRFDNRQHLDDWLGSERRAKLLDEGRKYYARYDVQSIRSAFGGWFGFGGGEGAPPNWKQAMMVYLGISPIVFILNLTLLKGLTAAGVPPSPSVYIYNMVSVPLLTLLLPLLNKAFAFWLVPAQARPIAVNVAGTAAVVACNLLLLAIFWLGTS